MVRTVLLVLAALLSACSPDAGDGDAPASPASGELAWHADGAPEAEDPGRTVLSDGTWEVTVIHDETGRRPSDVEVVESATGEARRLRSPRPASGGSWSLHEGVLRYPSWGEGRTWCLATVSLEDMSGEVSWCAGRREGWSSLTTTGHGVGLMTFDDSRPVACRTVNLLGPDGAPEPVEGPTPCTAWDVAAVDGGVVWSEVPKPRRQEEATFHARMGDETLDLGPGQTGSLVPCGDSVYWARDPQARDDPARLMRWHPGSEVAPAYASEARGNVFLGQPTCTGNVLTLSVFSELGDEQVRAEVPLG